MRIRCTALAPELKDALRFGADYQRRVMDFDLTLGKEYVVLALGAVRGAVWADIETGSGWPVTVPMMLFEVVDPTLSRFWSVRYGPDESLELLPKLFEAPTFASRLADGDPDLVGQYRELCRAMDEENSDRRGRRPGNSPRKP
jgi:hypothetical protein